MLCLVTSNFFTSVTFLDNSRLVFVQVREEFGGCVTAKKMTSFVAGGVILGMGMTLSGAVSMDQSCLLSSFPALVMLKTIIIHRHVCGL